MPQPDRLAIALGAQALTMPEQGRIVVLRATASSLFSELDPARLGLEQSFRPWHDALAAAGLPVTARAEGPAAMVVVNLTRSRTENLGNIARGLEMLAPGGLIAVDGAKTDGVDSLARQIATVLPLAGQFSKAHGRLFWLTRPAVLPAVVAEWAAAAAPARNADGLVGAPGLFSPEHADPGSRQLADGFRGRLKGRVADLGAGWGWLALQALAVCPEITALDLYEAEARALDAARLNVTDPRAAFHWADVLRLEATRPPHDAIITNPPFHQGRAAEPDIGAGFIAAAARLLKPSGILLMVANRQLPYEAALDERFRNWERLSQDGGYKVILARSPRRG